VLGSFSAIFFSNSFSQFGPHVSPLFLPNLIAIFSSIFNKALISLSFILAKSSWDLLPLASIAA